MLYETLSQPLILILLLIVGFASGMVFDLNNVIFFLCNKKKWVRIILDILSCIFVFLIFFILILNIAYGEIRFYQILIFALALSIQRMTIGKLVVKLIFICYNYIGKIFTWVFNFFKKFFKKGKIDDKNIC